MNIDRCLYQVKELKDNLKYRRERAIKGYSTLDRWNIHSWFEEIMPKILLEYKNNLHGCPSEFVDDENGNSYQSVEEGVEAWEAILERMIFCFNEMNEEKCSMKNEYKDEYLSQAIGDDFFTKENFKLKETDPVLEENYRKKQKEIMEYRDKMKDEGLDLFKKYFWNLWD